MGSYADIRTAPLSVSHLLVTFKWQDKCNQRFARGDLPHRNAITDETIEAVSGQTTQRLGIPLDSICVAGTGLAGEPIASGQLPAAEPTDNAHPKHLTRAAWMLGLFLGLWLISSVVWGGDATIAGTATAQVVTSGWVSFESPFTGDDDRDGWTVTELGLTAAGPFDLGTRKIPGSPEWRADSYRGLTANTDYYLQITYVDPDGVSGPNPQVIGPVHTLATAANAVTLGTAKAEGRETEIFVSLPISDDANGNSYGTVEIANDAGGPWTERCGSPSENRLPHHPKRCRLRSLTPGSDYWVRIDIADPDGINGADPQVLGPITYTGLENVAAGRPITADPGWGCCPNPAQLVDGRIQYRFWTYGFAWTGGTTGYAGGPAGWKQATIDLGAATTFGRVEVWFHNANSPPIDWRVETSDDGAGWSTAWSTTAPQCRGASEALEGTTWAYPACSQRALFAPVTARYVRYWFDDRTLFGGLHGWAVELEVFPPSPPPPIAHPGADRTIDVDQSILLGASPSATGGTPPYSYLWTAIPGDNGVLSSTTTANPSMRCWSPEIVNIELVVTDANAIQSVPASAEITVICPQHRDFYNVDFYDLMLWEAMQTITAEWVTIKTGADVMFRAGSGISLMEDFVVEEGAILTLEIDPGTDCELP